MKSLYERENLKRGDVILCDGEERIFLAIGMYIAPFIVMSVVAVVGLVFTGIYNVVKSIFKG